MRTSGHFILTLFSQEYFKIGEHVKSLNLLFKHFERSRHLIRAHIFERTLLTVKTSWAQRKADGFVLLTDTYPSVQWGAFGEL